MNRKGKFSGKDEGQSHSHRLLLCTGDGRDLQTAYLAVATSSGKPGLSCPFPTQARHTQNMAPALSQSFLRWCL